MRDLYGSRVSEESLKSGNLSRVMGTRCMRDGTLLLRL